MQKIKFLFAGGQGTITEEVQVILDNYKTNAVIEEACDGSTVLEKIHTYQYELILLDVNLPPIGSEDVVNKILEFHPEARILVFGNIAVAYAKKLIQLGAKGYVSILSEAEFQKGIESVLNNKRYISAAPLEHMTQEMFRNKFRHPFNRLSKREVEILKHLHSEEKIGEISGEPDLEKSIIGTYKARLLQKLNCADIMRLKSLARNYILNHGTI